MPKSDGYKPNDAMASAAERGLKLRKENGGKGGTAVGVARARDIANKKNLSLDTVKRMNSFFSRHKGNEKSKPGQDRNKDKGYIAFLLWGGAAGKKWAKSIIDRESKSEKSVMRNKIEKVFCLESIDISVGTIDRDKGIVFGAKVIQLGPINDDRPFVVDEETLEQVVAYGNNPNKGIKVRLTHPQGEAMGLHLGRAKDFRRDGDSVRADIHLASAASISPRGDIANYVMTLAEEDSESLGMSVATILDREAMSELAGDDGVAPLRFSHLYAVDVVTEPAATRGGMFSNENEDDMNVNSKLDEKFEEHDDEEKKEEAESKKDEMKEEEKKEEAQEEKKDEEGYEEEEEDEDKKEGEADEHEDDDEEMSKQPMPEYEAYIEAFGDQGAVWFLRKRPLNECFAEYLHEYRKENEKLKADLEAANQKLEAFSQSLGEAEPATKSAEVELSEAEIRHQEFISNKKEQGWSDQEIRWASLFAK